MIERLRGDFGGWLLIAFGTAIALAAALLGIFGDTLTAIVAVVVLVIVLPVLGFLLRELTGP